MQWLDQPLESLSDALLFGIFLAALLAIAWFVFVQRGMPHVWRGGCRTTACMVDFIVGMLLLPEYVLTTRRRRRGQPPGPGTLLAGEIADRVLDGAASMYERHPRQTMAWKKFPWKVCSLIVAGCAAAWLAWEQLPIPRDLRGGSGPDRLVGGHGADLLKGNDGNDYLDGRDGNDRLSGGAGDDRLRDSRGRDRFLGGRGKDRIDARDISRGDRRDADTVRCGPGGRDLVFVDRRDRVGRSCERRYRR